ncbi:uncharacterized protein I303_101230 [Kwoniella dejecticola CBS 10117]|uniref:Ferric oxidoreductase domain-containing protein n=1 Tax=Kwoniella dejecticola CBS 10117 TaxID=1296121 RepID=A0A1A6AH66_9TREE|nr:uncharacterized protein I303_01236 [Kwoniella dejecticola CBS 10117]OBR89409.1 hypothetical protein I303_01236 [Kwoniella dejecticola CBS 10117]
MYDPVCCSACKNVVPTYMYCAPEDVDQGMGGMSMVVLESRQTHDMDINMEMGEGNSTENKGKIATDMPGPNCLATNIPYLRTAAWCIDTHCQPGTSSSGSTISVADVELWWWMNIVGVLPDQPSPVMTYQEALSSITVAIQPNSTLPEDTPLTSPVLVDADSYTAQWNILVNFQRAETLHSKYSIILISTCFVLPIFLSLLRFIPFPLRLINLFNAHMIEAPLFNRDRPLTLPFFGDVSLHLPTRGQSLFIFWIVLINILCCSLGFHSVQPNAWWTTRTMEIATYIANRSGAISFANIPLLILYAGRNKILLLWLTDWSFSTFILLHKVVGVLATVEASLHSAIYLQIYLSKGISAYNEESRSPYWILGVLATLSMVLILPLSIRKFRKTMYELFLLLHIGLAVLTIVGCWYHIIWRFDHQWGYELWMYIAMAVWAFERVFRVLRLIRKGVRYAMIYRIDEDYLRMDIPDLDPDGCKGYIYVYFLNVNWRKSTLPRPWESHPFSIASYDPSPPRLVDATTENAKSEEEGSDILYTPQREQPTTTLTILDDTANNTIKSEAVLHDSPRAVDKDAQHRSVPILHRKDEDDNAQTGISILVRIEKGITSELSQFAISSLSSAPAPIPRKLKLPILIEGPYGTRTNNSDFLNEYINDSAKYPKIVCIAGGVGITAVLPKLQVAVSSPLRTSKGPVKLYWGARTRNLIDAVEDLIATKDSQDGSESESESGKNSWGDIQTHFQVGTRLHLQEIVDDELKEGEKGTLVVVSGPKGMANEVRRSVITKAKQGIIVKFVQESFDW